jgi:hypothetical protein
VFRSAVTKTDPATGETSVRVYEVEGPIAYLETTTSTNLNHENATRAFEVTLDESEAQTQRIHELQRRRRSEAYMQETAATYVDPDDICRRHHNAQRLLRPLLVLNRFDEHLMFPSRRPRTRRDHERFLSLVDTVALLHQYSREINVLPRPGGPVEYVVATIADYRIAYELAKGVLDVTLHELSRHGQDLKGLISDMVLQSVEGDVEAAAQVVFTRRQLREFTQWEDHRLRDTLSEMVELEHLSVTGGGGHGATVRYRLLPDDAGYGPNLAGLTTPDELEARAAVDRPVLDRSASAREARRPGTPKRPVSSKQPS